MSHCALALYFVFLTDAWMEGHGGRSTLGVSTLLDKCMTTLRPECYAIRWIYKYWVSLS